MLVTSGSWAVHMTTTRSDKAWGVTALSLEHVPCHCCRPTFRLAL
jgi:hypothetical protein